MPFEGNIYLTRAIEESFRQNKPVPMMKSIDQQGRYWITSDGRLLSVCGEVPLYRAFYDNGHGYLYVDINDNNYSLHRLLALSFNGDKEKEKIFNNCEVHHFDFDRSNNSLNNLCILTPEKHRTIHNIHRRLVKWEEQQRQNLEQSQTKE